MLMPQFVSQTTFHVRYAETDTMGIVHHSSYIVYFEEGRSDYMRQRGEDYANFEREGHYLAVSEVHARYVSSARYGDRVTVRTWISELLSRALTFEYEIVNAETGVLFVAGKTRHICITHAGQVARIPERWRVWMQSE